MNRIKSFFRSKTIGFIIITSCVAIVLLLVVSIVLATFTSFRSSTRDAVNTQTRELSAQIVYNYENYISSIIETSNIIQTDVDRYELYTPGGGATFSKYLAQIVRLKSDIIKIAVYDVETGLCLSSSYAEERGLLYRTSDGEWFDEAISDPTVHVFSVPYSDTGREDYKVNISKQIKLQNGSQTGVLKIEISFQNFIELVEKSNLGEGGHITIIDPDYNIVYTSLAESGGENEIGVIRGIVLGTKNAFINGHDMTVTVETLSNTKWRICVFINADRLTQIERTFLTTTVLVSFGVLVLGIVMYLWVSRLITDPMKQLEMAMRKVEKSDYFRMEEVELTASREVEELSLRFNKMMQKISELMERVITEQDAQRRSELKALQNQINPHFLYNTLDSIIWLIENNKNEEASEMVVALARLFRIGISKDKEIISVKEELEHVRNYLLIQSVRYHDSFDYEFIVQDDALTLCTMKLILQPIVENCIYHGLKNKIDRGKITIGAKRENGFLVLWVSDNGYGMRPQAIDALYHSFEDGVVSDGVGLKNIYQRVMIYYEGRANMVIESELDEGTTITIKEPVEQ